MRIVFRSSDPIEFLSGFFFFIFAGEMQTRYLMAGIILRVRNLEFLRLKDFNYIWNANNVRRSAKKNNDPRSLDVMQTFESLPEIGKKK